MSGLVLIIEDEALLARNVKVFLTRNGYEVETAETLAAGLKAYERVQPDIILLDQNLPDGNGLSFLEDVRKRDRWTKIVMITAHGGVDVAVAAMKAGADDYLTKPVSLDEILLLTGKLTEQLRVEGALSYLNEKNKDQSGLGRIKGQSPAITEMKQRIKMLLAAEQGGANSNEAGPPVLIIGETGTGKELVARALHYDGTRGAMPFVSVNCAALPEQLIEAELFGHERGAFTGATEKKIGLFQAADKGTLFLDEIGELPLAQQAKFLKAIEDKTIRAVGSVRDRTVNVRFIAATNADLDMQSREGQFRSDLFYRLNTVTIHVPPLRARGEDIIVLAQSFVEEFQDKYGRARLLLTDEARNALLRYPWPGNVRELRNVIERACLMCARNQIDVADLDLRELPPLVPAGEVEAGMDKSLVDVERSHLIAALRKAVGNVTLAARQLGISRDTLRYRMEKHLLKRSDYI